MVRFDSEGAHPVLVEAFTSIAGCDESAALRVLQMPFMDDVGGGYDYERSDSMILEGLARIAQTRRGALEELLSLPELQNGITDPLTATALLLILEREDSAAAAAIRELPWIADGITYIDHDRPDRTHNIDWVKDETLHVINFVELAQRANKSFWAYLELPWIADGIQSIEREVAMSFRVMGIFEDEATARILKMPFLETMEGDEERIIDFLVRLAFDRGLSQLLSSPRLEGGIKDGKFGTVALASLEIRDPEAAAALKELAWIQDGIDPSDQVGVHIMVFAATESGAVFRALLAKSWVQDGLTQDEPRVVETITQMAHSPGGKGDEALALRILDMPFLQEVGGLDAWAVISLRDLSQLDDDAALQLLLSHPELRDGITDEWTDLVAPAFFAQWNPALLPVLLDPEQPPVERRTISLPLAGEVRLSVIETEGLEAGPRFQRGEGAWEPLDLLDHVLRTHEEFVGLPHPATHTLLLIGYITEDKGGAHYGGGLITSRHRSAYVITHEAAHNWDMVPIWLYRPNIWMYEGAAEFLTSISERARTGAPLPRPRDSCRLANSIAELVRLELSYEEVYQSACHYTLGVAMYLDLYDNLGDAAFRRGFRSLILASQEENAAKYSQALVECADIDTGLCFFREAFLAALSPEEAGIAEGIINRRYYGSEQ